MRYDLPHAAPGQAIGLLGGSFDPPHEGHVHITREALKRFGLDRVWWLVSPGNPLKPHGPAPLARRLAAARSMMAHPAVTITDLEARLGTRYTAATLMTLMKVFPDRRFVWLMGADNLAQFHRWDNWTWILANVPVGVLARPGGRMAALNAPAARFGRHWRLPASESRRLPFVQAPAWCFCNMPMLEVSSSAIRARGDWR
ncbi:nicotinate-nucleotide adenylyltransferase [Tropicimonas sp. IMCC6043]|uniref:nicotinate-nucleotide adenylyltransferase n=1 Tax=Tropicimonas sp. IMCC6043 TaxID=2510645 RepID=UPI00101C920C|nr:nicotinate-nucleotide adenylyltransferase [Tropicimonas sp. IMCC6043]RYH09517.1 nicotinate-nucleotide adenylyltransferase [Tropicimonas sp. IMCC6043]